VIIARTDADAADLLLTDHDARDARFLTGERSSEGFFHVKAGIEQAIDRGLSYAPYADLCGARHPSPTWPRRGVSPLPIHAQFPGKLLAYNARRRSIAGQARRGGDEAVARGPGGLGYRFQFITLAGWHALNLSMFELASAYRADGMLGYSQLQQREFGQESGATGPPSIRPSSAPAISTRCRPPSARARIPPARWRAAPRPSNSPRR